MATIQTKACSKCGKVQPSTAEFFGHNPQGGLRNSCRACKRAYEQKQHVQKPELTAVRRERYKKRLDSAPGIYTDQDIALIRSKLNDCCFYCGTPLKGCGEKDHIVAISKGGTNWPSNITLACMRCNKDKYDKSVSDFVAWRKERGLKISKQCLEFLAAQIAQRLKKIVVPSAPK